ncbi:MAG: hypothetical protein CVU05_00345 [Bacteroidetes bacterium HGW-Bacteroidetes-21]|jgi:outer membrane protein OmpA-like peptidoglycan-associated protein|nr:MAG: hypothetical protein CVU05_00345 [Bacteroidetes bacterium HGW-Bacteroidetes-21]
MIKRILLFFVLLVNSVLLFAQTGDEYFTKKEYASAIARYEQEIKSKPEKYFNLAKAYFAIKEFDKSIAALENYKKLYTSADIALADKWITLLKRDDEYIEVNNSGELLNSPQSDYFPYVSKDGNTLYFTTKDRANGFGGEDIWFCERNSDGTWGKAQNINTQLNTKSHECMMSMSGDGNVSILFGNYEGSFGGGDLFYSVKTEKGWTMPCNLGGTINSKNWQSQASLAADGKTLLFISDVEGGFGGGADIYVSVLSEEGWSKPVNLGPKINTPGFEGWPFLAADGKTLYFFSDGHFGFGGHDIFMAKKIGESWTDWSEPVNMGKYINTLDDDKYLSIPSSGIKAYTVRTNQPEGYGESDIYEFIIPPSMRPEIVINVYGYVTDENKAPVGAVVRFYDSVTGVEQASASSNFTDGLYRVSLPPLKKYNVVIDMKGYLYLTDVIDLTDLSKFTKVEYMNERLAEQLPEIKAMQEKLTALNNQLFSVINENSTNIDNAFKNYDDIIKAYRTNLNSLDLSIKKSKLAWMSKEDKIMDVRKDFQLQTIRVGATFELKNIFFDSGKATLREESKTELDKLVDIMKKSEIVIELGGHTDSIGTDESNIKLSQERVNSVMQYLIDNQIKPERIKAVGYGESQPLASNSTDEGRQKNRRVEVKILQLQLAREGQDVYTDQPKEVKPEEKFDFLSTLQNAAQKGGLPSNSPCSNEVKYLTDIVPTTTTTDPQYTTPTRTPRSTYSEVERDNFVYKTFNPYLKNLSLAEQNVNGANIYEGSSLGVGVNFVSEKLRETTFEYYFVNDDSIKWMGYFNFNYNWQFFKSLDLPLLTIFGVNTHFWQHTSNINGSDGAIILNMPIGFRYNIEISDDLYAAPMIKYSFGTSLKDINDVSSKYFTVGVDARYKFIQGGLNYNSGELIKYLGFRIGFAF